ncbi:MAG TPA: hypothetical protein VJI69_02985 [Bacteroidia bacterium]|nr:hypothetical protein [Bacteroidia bacterium]
MKKVYFLSICILLFALNLVSQVSVKDSSIYTPYIGVSYGYHLPEGNMLKRFGNSSTIGLNLEFKTKKQWTFGINGSYIFGKDVKESLFDSIATSSGAIINGNGAFADVRLYERGFTTSLTAGRLFSFKKPNPNSGIMFNVGVGFIQHKIRIETIGNNAPQLSKQYKKGYDRLTNGFLLSQNLGYLYLSDNRLVNFYIGFECMQGFTQSRRSYDYDLMKQDTEKRVDILYGGKFAWILPMYKRAPQEFYTY